jgi:CDGSH-type Zn-finger protein
LTGAGCLRQSNARTPARGETISTSKGQIVGTAPIQIEMEVGRNYFWCACRQSKNQPFCDGSHKGSGFTPVKWTTEVAETKGFCICEQTEKAPFCDGSHKRLTP